jgi:hypothetical protein
VYLVGIAVWLLRRDYDGIRHDGMFYTGQTMVRMGDANIASDLFFIYGSQDQYTIFSSVMAFLVRHFGWIGASMGSVIASQIGFLAGATLLLLEFAPLPLVGLGIAYCAITPFYGPFNIFSIGEPFTTSRSLAEPLLLFAVYAMLKRRTLLCAILVVLASLIHPLLAAPVFCVLIAMAWSDYPTQRRWMLAGLGAAVVVLFTAAWLKPDFFFSTYDDEWWGVLTRHTGQVSMRAWEFKAWALVAVDLMVPLLLARTLDNSRLKHLLNLTSLVLAWSLLISAWGSDIIRSVFLTEIQIWRAEAFAHVLAIGLFPFLLWQLRGNGITTLLGGLFIILGIDYQSIYSSAAIAVPAGLALLAIGDRVSSPSKSMKVLVAIFVVIAVGAGLYNQLDISQFYTSRAARFRISSLIHNIAATWTVGLVFIAGVAALAARFRRAGLVVAALLLICMAGIWDNRTPFQVAMEERLGQPPLAADVIHPGQNVYWSDDLRLPWFLLDRQSFYSKNQAAGLVFKRQTAMEFLKREEWISPINLSLQACEQLSSMLGKGCTLARNSVGDVCAVGGPDFLLLDVPVEDIKPDHSLVMQVKGEPPSMWSIYSCPDVRTQVAALEIEDKNKPPAHKK